MSLSGSIQWLLSVVSRLESQTAKFRSLGKEWTTWFRFILDLHNKGPSQFSHLLQQPLGTTVLFWFYLESLRLLSTALLVISIETSNKIIKHVHIVRRDRKHLRLGNLSDFFISDQFSPHCNMVTPSLRVLSQDGGGGGYF